MKKLCRLAQKETERHAELLAREGGARFVCRRCARAARKKDALCKPLKTRRRRPKAST
ncbi:hypothetical protein [Chlorobium sp. N1]|uniref:hypothetical protein n=1 Tax=Chlorobium sp. N1 TaxID=2491138 RepID=UPI0013F170DF|nr:hypothetical protein [Chlorobium sp. N1]